MGRQIKKLIGIGAGGHTNVIIDILSENKEYKILGLIDKKYNKKKINKQIPIIGTDKELEYFYRKKIKDIFIGLAPLKNIKKSKKLYIKLKKIGFNVINIIHKTAILAKDIESGEGLKVFAGSIINPGVVLGHNVLINTGSIIEHDSKISSHVQIAPGVIMGGGITIGEGSIIGLGSRVLQGITIGKNCMIGSGTVVTKDVPDNTIYYNYQMIKKKNV